MRRGTWEWWRARQARKKERRTKLDDAWVQMVDQMDAADEEIEENRRQDHEEILASGYVLNEDGVYVRLDRGEGEPHPRTLARSRAAGVP